MVQENLTPKEAIASCTRSIVTGTRRFFKNPIMPLSSSLLKIFNGKCATDENIRNAWNVLRIKISGRHGMCYG